MPRIEQYTSQVGAPAAVPQPNQSGEAFGEQVAVQGQRNAQAMGGFGDSLLGLGAHIERRAAESEVSDLTVKMSELSSDYTAKLQDRLKNAKPGDQNITSDFIDEYNSETEALREKIQTTAGQRYFDRVNAHIAHGLTHAADAGQSELAGIQAVENIQKATQWNQTQLMRDPGSYWTSVKPFAEHNVEALAAGKLSPKQTERLKEEVQKGNAEAAVRGWIFTNPQEAHNQLLEGKWDNEFNSDVKYKLLGEAKVGIAAQRAQALQADADRKRALDAKVEAEKNDFVARLVDPSNLKGKYTVKDIVGSSLSSAEKYQFVQMMERDAETKVDPDKGHFNAMLTRTLLPEGTDGKIVDSNVAYQAAASGQISFGDAQKLASLIQGRRTEQGQLEQHLLADFLKTASPQIGQGNPGLDRYDRDAPARLYKFQYLVEKKVQAQRAANKPIEDLYNPGSPDFLGQYIPKFQVGMDEIMAQMVRGTSIETMSRAELKALDPKSLSPEQRSKAKQRWDELKGK